MDIIPFTDRFLDLEREVEAFSSPDWDPIRYDLFYHVYHTLSGANPSETPTGGLGTQLRRMAGRTQRRFLREKLLYRLAALPRDVLILQASRQSINGRTTDPATAPLVGVIGGRAHVIDSVPRYYHLPEAGRPMTLPLAPTIRTMIRALADWTGRALPAEVLAARAGAALAEFHRRVGGYHRILDAARPKLIIVNQNGSEKPLFRAAHQRHLPVIETQHGLIGYGHPAYTYAANLDGQLLDTVPDVFVTFAEHWSRVLHYPVRRAVSLGNDAMIPANREGEGEDIMVVSADIYHEVLSEWTRHIALARPARRFIYKLHPNQQPSAAAITAKLADLPNVRVIDGRFKASDFLGEVCQLVVVQSTVMYEALQLGIPLVVVAVQNYEVGRDVFDLPQVTVVTSPEALATSLDATPTSGPSPIFFEPFRPRAARALVDDLIRTGRPEERLS